MRRARTRHEAGVHMGPGEPRGGRETCGLRGMAQTRGLCPWYSAIGSKRGAWERRRGALVSGFRRGGPWAGRARVPNDGMQRRVQTALSGHREGG